MSVFNSILSHLGYTIARSSTYKNLISERSVGNKALRDMEFLRLIDPEMCGHALQYLQQSKAQLRQDLFVLAETKFKRNGFFVEFGATNGVTLSNSHLLEKSFEWRGILAEPGRNWHAQLQQNRNAFIESDCVWRESGEQLEFFESDHPEFSTIDRFKNSDSRSARRAKGKKYSVDTVSLNDLLVRHGAPKEIDYLSIDTEGSEYDILSKFNFDQFSVKIITCEHNYTDSRDKIYKLLTKNGFERKFEQYSLYDDWYISNTL